jgi:hypothetical protein
MVMAIARQHKAIFLTETWKQIELSKMDGDLVSGRSQDDELKKGRMLCNHSRLGCMRKPERGMLELWSFLDGNDQQQGKVRSDRYEGSGRSSLMKGALWN